MVVAAPLLLPELLPEEPAGGGALLLPQAARPALKPTQTRIALMLDFIFPVPFGRRLFRLLVCYCSTP